MNKLASISISVVILFAFSFCNATKEATQGKHPFKVTKATYNTWVGGRPGVKGININITIDNSEIELDTVFFRNMKTKLKRDVNSTPSIFIGVFALQNTKKDYILHEDPVKEYGNTPPNISLNIPFELKNNEAVISYFYKGNTKYYKIENVKETKSIIMY